MNVDTSIKESSFDVETSTNKDDHDDVSFESTLDVLKNITDTQKYYEAVRSIVNELYKRHGSNYVQKALQTFISKVKKLESEVASVRNKVKNADKDINDTRASILQAESSKESLERLCKNLQLAAKEQRLITKNATEEMKKNFSEVQGKVTSDLAKMQERVEEHRQSVAATINENERLRAEVAKEKENFEKAYTTHQETMKKDENSLRELVVSYQKTMEGVEVLRAKLATVLRERREVAAMKEAQRQQNEVYAAKFAETSQLADLDALKATMTGRLAELEAAAAALAKEAEGAKERRAAHERELAQRRAAVAAAKRELQNAERARVKAEQQCRQAQQKLHLKQK